MPKAKSFRPDSRQFANKIYGIDFSGAKNAGSKIWIASAIILGNMIEIEDCYQAKHLPNSAAGRDQCLSSLRHFISSRKTGACGLDFPFGLPGRLVEANDWEEFVLSFGSRYTDPEKFRQSCLATASNHEVKRETDEKAKAPWCAYNRRIYKQTYYGIRDVLAPLLRSQMVSVLPMQSRSSGKPWLLEVCPASTLKRMDLHQPYKGHSKDRDKRANREHILEKIEDTGIVTIKSSALRATILENPGGDALDSVIAAFTTFQAIGSFTDSSVSINSNSVLEGYVYF